MSEALDYGTMAPEAPEIEELEPAPHQPRQPYVLTVVNTPNIAEDLSDDVLAKMGAKVCEEFQIDDDSLTKSGWKERCKSAMDQALQVKTAKTTPWPNASNVKFPLISTAAIQFNARAYPAVVDGPEIVKGAVKGRPTPEKIDRADRIGKHMSWQLLEEMDDWEEDTDRLLIQLPIVGCAFRKTWFDPLKGYNCSHLVGAQDFVVNYMTKDLDTCPRATHILTFYPHEIREKMLSGSWLEVELGTATDAANDDDAPHTFYEQHRLWDLDEDGYAEPYIVTVHKETQRVVRVVARFDETGVTLNGSKVVRIVAYRCFTKYGFIPAPDGSFYDIGFGTLLAPLSGTIDTTINQLMDAGHLANVQGGFIGEGVSIKSGNMRFQPGEWKKAGVAGSALKDNIVPLPVKEPSAVLYNLMVFLIDAAKDVTATQDIMTGDTGHANQPVGTTLAVIEQGLKTFTAIVKRVHRALKQELKILYRLNSRYLNPQVYFTFQDVEGDVALEDYRLGDIDVVPVSDPNMATDMQRMGRAQFLMGLKGQGLDDMEIMKRVLEAASIPDIKSLMPKEPPPVDPKVIEAQGKAEQGAAKIELQRQDQGVKAQLTAAQAAEALARAEQITAETAMMSPQVFAFAEQVAREAVRQALGMAHGQQPEPGPPDAGHVPGVEGPPADGPLPPTAGGPAPATDGELGPGGPDVGGGPIPGAPPFGPPDAQLG